MPILQNKFFMGNPKSQFIAWSVLAVMALTQLAEAKTQRSTAARHAFVKANACPATGQHRLPCHGWQIDHVMPLKCNGPDTTGNMQWLSVEDHKAKTKREAKLCRASVVK